MNLNDQVDLTEFDRLAHEAWARMMLNFDTPIPAPSWAVWAHRSRARLWEGVALSLNFEPVAVRLINRRIVGIDSLAAQLLPESPLLHRRAHEATVQRRELELLPRLMMDDGFVTRLQMASDHVSADGPLRPVHPIPSAGVEHVVVQLAEFANWTKARGDDLPREFPEATQASDASPPAERPEPMPVVQDRALEKILEGKGHPGRTVPRHKGGKPSELKAACWEEAKALRGVFTRATFEKAWGRLKVE